MAALQGKVPGVNIVNNGAPGEGLTIGKRTNAANLYSRPFSRCTNNGVVTDLNGKYTLNHVPENATLVVSYIGMLTQEIKVNGQSTINIILKEDSQQLEEIIVIGYGAAKAKDLTAPFLVVISTTPFAARTPYIAAAEASFKIDIS